MFRKTALAFSATAFLGALSSVAQESETKPSEDDRVTIVTEVIADEPSSEEAQQKTQTIEIEIQEHASSDDGKKPIIRREGKMVVIGPDGQRREIQLDGNAFGGAGGQLNLDPEMLKKLMNDTNANVRVLMLNSDGEEAGGGKREPQWMVGILCEDVPAVVNRQLKLEGSGILVREALEDFPGHGVVQADDIILKANDVDIASLETFVEVVRKSEGNPVQLVVLRDGERVELEVTPEKREAPEPTNVELSKMEWTFDGAADGGAKMLFVPEGKGRVMVRQFGPGLRLQGGEQDAESMRKMIDAMIQQQLNNRFDEGALDRLLNEMRGRAEERERGDRGERRDGAEREQARRETAERDVRDGDVAREREERRQPDREREDRVRAAAELERAARGEAAVSLQRQLRELEAQMEALRAEIRELEKRD